MGKIFSKPVINRFQGTPVKPYHLKSLKHKLFLIHYILAMRAPCEAVIMANDGTRGDEILRLLGVEEDKIHFWMNGLDVVNMNLPVDFEPAALKDHLGIKDKKIILMVSKLKIWKRVDRGIQCLCDLIHQHGVQDVVLIVVGDGPEKHKLQRMAESLKVIDSVRFVGALPHTEVGCYYHIADLFLSLYDLSNLGNPLIEAMYFGTPIITIKDGSTDELLKDRFNAFLVPKADLKDALPRTIKDILGNEALRTSVGKKAEQTFQAKCRTWEERMKLESELIECLASKWS